MKGFKKLLLFILTLLLSKQLVKSQDNNTMTFKCENFYGNGITEYLDYTVYSEKTTKDNLYEFYYYTSLNPKK